MGCYLRLRSAFWPAAGDNAFRQAALLQCALVGGVVVVPNRHLICVHLVPHLCAVGTTSSVTASQPLAPPTMYRLAGDQQLPPVFPAVGRLQGGACRASGEHEGAQQTVQCLFDGSSNSKWLDFGGGGEGGSAWAEYRLLQEQEPAWVVSYDLVSAEDCPERDPSAWVLECMREPSAAAANGASISRTTTSSTRGATGAAGQQQGGTHSSQSTHEEWVVVDERCGESFSGRNKLRTFAVATPLASRRFRLRVMRTASPAAANSVQLCCFNLYTQPLGSSASPSTSLLDGALQAMQQAGSGDTPPGAQKAVVAQNEAQLLLRIAGNMQRLPGEAKFLEVRATKVPALLEQPVALQVLLGLGFRPLLAPQRRAAGGQAAMALGPQPLELMLKAEGSTADVQAAQRICSALEALLAVGEVKGGAW